MAQSAMSAPKRSRPPLESVRMMTGVHNSCGGSIHSTFSRMDDQIWGCAAHTFGSRLAAHTFGARPPARTIAARLPAHAPREMVGYPGFPRISHHSRGVHTGGPPHHRRATARAHHRRAASRAHHWRAADRAHLRQSALGSDMLGWSHLRRARPPQLAQSAFASARAVTPRPRRPLELVG